MRKTLTVGGLLIALAAAAGAGGQVGAERPVTGPSGDPIPLGAIHPMTGGLAGAGSLMTNAAQLAVADINADGGVAGSPLELLEGDSQGRAEVGQSEAQRLIDAGAVALIGTYQSDVAQNVASVAERSGVPFVVDVAAADSLLEQGYSYTFRLQPDGTTLGTSGAENLAVMSEELGLEIESVSYLRTDAAFSESVFGAFEAAATEHDIEIAAEVVYSATDFTDATTQVSTALASSPDAVVVSGYYPDSLLIVDAIRSLDSDVIIYGTANGAFNDDQFPADAGQAGQNVLSANYHYDATSDDVVDLRERFEAEYGEPMTSDAMLAYQAVVVVAEALESSEEVSRDALRDALGEGEFTSLIASTGPVQFDEVGQNQNAAVVIMQVQDDRIEQVFPADLATADVRLGDGA